MELDKYQWSGRIKEVRKSAGLSQAELAEKLGVSHVTVNRIENGKSVPDILSIMKISNLFDINPVWLIMGSEEKLAGEREAASPVFSDYQLLSEKAKDMSTTTWVRLPGLPDNCFLFKTHDQAMAPKILPGDFVAVVEAECRPGDTVLFADKYSVVMIRKLGRHSSGEEFFIAENPSYPPTNRTGEERIFGKVISGIRHFQI